MGKVSRDKSRWIFLALGASIALLVGLLLMQRIRERRLIVNYTQGNAPTARAPLPTNVQKIQMPPRPTASLAKGQATSATAASPEPTAVFQEALDEKSLRAIKEFEVKAHLRLPLPRKMQFQRFELEDNVASIYGYNGATKTDLTMMAYGKDATAAQALKFLKSEAKNLPNMRGTDIQAIDGGRSLRAPDAATGMGEGTMWSGQMSNGYEFHAVFLRRQDHLGTYMFVYSGPPSFFKGNDGAFDPLYDGVRALPP